MKGDFEEAAGIVVGRDETVQQGAERQLVSSAEICDGACPGAFMEGMAASFAIAIPCIDAPLVGRQQSGEE